MNLLDKKCVACEGGVPPMDEQKAHEYLSEVLGWNISDDKKSILREFEFSPSGGESAFIVAMKFVNKVAEIAESEGHHPDLHIFYSRVKIELSTHAIGGLSENDFIVAAKINALL